MAHRRPSLAIAQKTDWTDDALIDCLDQALGDLGAKTRFALAISGGGDSMALMLLADMWARQTRRPRPLVLTVDHITRPTSLAEAELVVKTAKKYRLPAQLLRDPDWPRPTANRQAAYRDYRYRLMAMACAEAGITHLCLGHNLDDQAETFLLRLARGSGVDGLSAMARRTRSGALIINRPLLDVPRSALRAFLHRRGQSFVDDPSNDDPAHARVRIRQAMASFENVGLSSQRLVATAHSMARAAQSLQGVALDLAREVTVIEPFGSIYLNYAVLGQAPEELRLRILALIILYMNGGPPPRLSGLMRLQADLAGPSAMAGITLGGCRWRWQGNHIHVIREARAIAAPFALMPGQATTFDNRFGVQLAPDGPGNLWIGPLGADLWAALRKESSARGIPARIGPCLPAIFIPLGPKQAQALGFLAVTILAQNAKISNKLRGLTIEIKGFDDLAPAWSD